MNRNKSTISRELRRNRGQRGYRPAQAHVCAMRRMQESNNSRRVAAKTWHFVEAKLVALWSPEQISGYLAVNGQVTISHECIYQHIYADKRAGGERMVLTGFDAYKENDQVIDYAQSWLCLVGAGRRLKTEQELYEEQRFQPPQRHGMVLTNRK